MSKVTDHKRVVSGFEYIEMRDQQLRNEPGGFRAIKVPSRTP